MTSASETDQDYFTQLPLTVKPFNKHQQYFVIIPTTNTCLTASHIYAIYQMKLVHWLVMENCYICYSEKRTG